MTPKGLYEKVAAMDTGKLINESIDATTEDLEKINRERMQDGLRADGSVMPIYSIISQQVYGYPNTPIKLKATGAFQAGLQVKRVGEIITTTSTDPKTNKLENKYGVEYGTSVFGTSGDYKKEYLDNDLRPELNKRINKATGLKFGK